MQPLAHHSEPIDPTLLEWILHQIDAVLAVGPLTMVLALGALVVVFPLAVAVFVLLYRRRAPR